MSASSSSKRGTILSLAAACATAEMCPVTSLCSLPVLLSLPTVTAVRMKSECTASPTNASDMG